MAVTQADIDAVTDQIKAMAPDSFSIGKLTVDQRKTLDALIVKKAELQAEYNRQSGFQFASTGIAGFDVDR